MTYYFDKSQLTEVKAQRKKVLIWYFVVLAIYLLFSIGFFVWYSFLPYADGKITLVKAIHLTLTGVFVIFSLIYLGIPFKRCDRFYKFCVKLDGGRKETSFCTYYKTDEEIIEKDGVDCKSLIFFEWNKYKGEYFERAVLVFSEKDFPILEENRVYELVTQGNFLISYKISEEKNKATNKEKQ